MSDTPRTDANTFNQEGKRPTGEDGEILSVPVEFSQELERELAAERALADRLGTVLDEIAGAFKENGWVLRPAITEALAAWKEARNAQD